MARDDDSFWLDIFRKSPLIATCMAICGLIGFGIGFYYFGNPELMMSIRLIACILFSFFCAGAFVGLIIGVIADSLIAAVRDDDKKKRKRN